MSGPMTFSGIKCMKPNKGKHNLCLQDGQEKERLGNGYSLPPRCIFHPPVSALCPWSQPLLMASPRLPGPLALGRPIGGTIKRREGKRRETCSLHALFSPGFQQWLYPITTIRSGTHSPGTMGLLLLSLCLGEALVLGLPNSYHWLPSPYPYVCYEPLY